MLRKNSNSHKILAYLYNNREEGATTGEILWDVDSHAFGTVSNDGPMGTLQKSGYVEKIRRGLYGITQGGLAELRRLGFNPK